MSFLFQYEIKNSDKFGIHVVSMNDRSGVPYKIHRNLKDETAALAVASDLAAAHRAQGHRCHVHNSLGQCAA
jgi:hypothetical protein